MPDFQFLLFSIFNVLQNRIEKSGTKIISAKLTYYQTLYRLVAHQVLLNNLIYVFRSNKAIKYTFGVNHYRWALAASI
jgi:hypothetical protein